MSDLVGNPDDRFSGIAAYITVLLCLSFGHGELGSMVTLHVRFRIEGL